MFYTGNQLGSAIGTSITGTIIQEGLRVRLEALFKDNPAGKGIATRVRNSLDFIDHLSPTLQARVRIIYAEASEQAFYFILILSGLAFVFTLFVKEKVIKA